ncbi:MAG: FAD-dependent oxidoreductase [Eubacteriales bacterium]|nr:FAD-dependent oxidoreductase [Eubacteriales bacterium]MDD3866262.1 FAD-dependent oxidoreductase [Eubacteriales bacterium]
MRILIIGGVAAGPSAAAKASRNQPDAEIVLYERDRYISYSACGMPFYLTGELTDFQQIVPRSPDDFQRQYGVKVLTEHEVLKIDPERHRILVRRLADQMLFEDQYDRLIIATGARAVRLPVRGHNFPNVFTLRTPGDILQIERYIKDNQPRHAAIIGSGAIGLEMAESLSRLGLDLTIIEREAEPAPAFSPLISRQIRTCLQGHQIHLVTGATVSEITGDDRARQICFTGREPVPADLVLVAVGIRPETKLALSAGISCGSGGAIRVNDTMQTSQPDIYACGDCCEIRSVIDGSPIYHPQGTTANKTGRVAGDAATGGSLTFDGAAGTVIFRLFDLTVAMTGLTEQQATERGFIVRRADVSSPDRPYGMGGRKLTIDAIADRANGRILGAQAVGAAGVDKRIDVLATAITAGISAASLANLDLAYAPPYASVRDPVTYLGMQFGSDKRND